MPRHVGVFRIGLRSPCLGVLRSRRLRFSVPLTSLYSPTLSPLSPVTVVLDALDAPNNLDTRDALVILDALGTLDASAIDASPLTLSAASTDLFDSPDGHP